MRSSRGWPGEITPGEAERIAGVVDTFVGAIATARQEGSRLTMLQILTADDDDRGTFCCRFAAGAAE